MSDAPRRASEALPVVRAGDLARTPAEARWLVDHLWADAGVGVIGGAPKCCKSWLGLDLALSVASGTPCIGAFAVPAPGPALIYLAEDAPETVRDRLDGLCRVRGLTLVDQPVHVIVVPVLRLDLSRDQDRLERTVRDIKPRVLLLDPFVRLQRIDENSAGEVSALLAWLRELQREHRLAIVVVHHLRKSGSGANQPGQALRGSGDFHAWGDSNLYLRRSRDSILLGVEHRAAPAPPSILLRLAAANGCPPHLAVVPGASIPAATPRGLSPQDLDDAVVRVLADRGEPLGRTALRAALHVRNESLGEALERLAKAGRVIRQGDHHWGVVPGAPT